MEKQYFKLVDEFYTEFKSNKSVGLSFLRDNIKLLNSDLFWEKCNVLTSGNIIKDGKFISGEVAILHHLCKIQIFVNILKIEISKTDRNIASLKINKLDALKILYFVLELGECYKKQPDNTPWDFYFPKYDEYSLKAIQSIVKSITDKSCVSDNRSALILKKRLILEIELLYLNDIRNAILYGNYRITNNYNIDKTFCVEPCFPDYYTILQKKQFVKKIWVSQNFKDSVSKIKQIEKYNSLFKTTEGFPGSITTANITERGTPKGQVSIQIPDQTIFENHENLMAFYNKAQFQYFLYHSLLDLFVPNDLIDISSEYVKINDNLKVTILDIFLVITAVKSISIIHYNNTFPKISFMRREFHNSMFNKIPETYNEIYVDNHLVDIFLEVSKSIEFRAFVEPFSKEDIIRFLLSIEELKDYTANELISILDFIYDYHRQKFPIFTKIDNQYYHSIHAHCKINFCKLFYDYCITNSLFNIYERNIDKSEKETPDKAREINVCKSVSGFFEFNGFNSCSNIEYPNKDYYFGDLEGDIDCATFSRNENILLLFQVKLSNTFSDNFHKRWQWSDSNLDKKARKQLYNDYCLTKVQKGLEFINEKLNCTPMTINNSTKVYQMVVVDNFYCDHQVINWGHDNKKSSFIISLFELDCLLNRKEIFEPESELWIKYHLHYIKRFYPSLIIPDNSDKNSFIGFIKKHKFDFWQNKKISLKRLIKIIESNLFWDFLDDIPHTLSEYTLKTVTDENNIKLKFKF